MVSKIYFVVFFILLFIAIAATYPSENEHVHRIEKGGDSPWNQFEVYSFKHNQHRCYVAVKQDGNIDLECP